MRRRLSVLVAGLCAPLLLATGAQAHPDDALTDDPREHTDDQHPAQDSFFHGGPRPSLPRRRGRHGPAARAPGP